MWVLMLNDMRSPKSEQVQSAARGETRVALERMLLTERVELYREPGFNCYGPVNWCKQFRKGGPLEWFNAPSDFEIGRGLMFIDMGASTASENAATSELFDGLPIAPAVHVSGERRCTDCKHFQVDLGWSGFEMAHHLGSVDCGRNHGSVVDGDDVDENGRAESTAARVRLFVRMAATCADFEAADP
jgi:hypothetical protein